MRRLVAAVCHGGVRRPLEPHGWAAPLARAVAWALSGTAGLALLLVPVAYAASAPVWVAGVLVYAAATALTVALFVRLLSGSMRPTDVVLTPHLPDER